MKKSVAIVLGIILILVVGIGAYVMSSYNSTVTMDEQVKSSYAQVENQLKRRADLIPNLINTVKGYAAQEEEVLTKITEARAGITSAKTPGELANADAQLNKALNSLNIVVENYPDLKSNQNFLGLQAELEGTENRIAVARRDYNESVKNYNNRLRRFPNNIIASAFNFEKQDYFEVSDADTELPEVDFSK